MKATSSNVLHTYFVQFIFRPVDLDVYTLSIHGFQVIELEGRVFSFVDQRPEEWVVTYRENYDAYT